MIYKVTENEKILSVNDELRIRVENGLYYEENKNSDSEFVVYIGRVNNSDSVSINDISFDKINDWSFRLSLNFGGKLPDDVSDKIMNNKEVFVDTIRKASENAPTESSRYMGDGVFEVTSKRDYKYKYKIIKNEEKIKIGYYTSFAQGLIVYTVYIFTKKSYYVAVCMFPDNLLAEELRRWCGESEEDDEKFLDVLLEGFDIIS